MDTNRVINENESVAIQPELFSEINTKISDYSVTDIFNLLEIKLDDYEDYEILKNDAIKKIEAYIKIFDDLKNYKIVNFFKEIQNSLFGSIETNKNMTEAQKLLEIYTEKDEQAKQSKIIENNINVNRHTVTKLLTIDSRFRSNYNDSLSTHYSINLPYIINNVTEMKLSDMEFPATFYPFQDAYENNYLWLKYTYYSRYLTTVSITRYIYFYVPSGNYYHTTLLDNMQATIDENEIPITISHDLNFDNDGGIGDGTGTVTIEYNGDTDNNDIITEIEINMNGSKIPDNESNYNTSHIIESTSDSVKYYNSYSAIDYKTRMGWMLGFRDSLYTGSTSYTTEGQLEVIGPRYIYLLVNDFNSSQNVNFFSNKESNLLDGNIMGRISLKGFAFSIQSQNDFTVYGEPRYYFGPVNINHLEVKVIDEFGRIVDLNGMDFSFTLQMTVKYDVS